MLTIIDTDALFGLFNPHDVHHDEVAHISDGLVKLGIETALLPTTLAEFATLTSRRVGLPQSQDAVRKLRALPLVGIDISDPLTTEALSLFEQQRSKENTLFDCYVMAATKRISARCIFSFDEGYLQNGFMLAKNIV